MVALHEQATFKYTNVDFPSSGRQLRGREQLWSLLCLVKPLVGRSSLVCALSMGQVAAGETRKTQVMRTVPNFRAPETLQSSLGADGALIVAE